MKTSSRCGFSLFERSRDTRSALALLPLVTSLTGCATLLAQGQAGAVVGTSGALGGAVEGSYGIGAAGVGLDVTARAKFTTGVLSGALGGGLFAAASDDYGGPFFWGHLGMHALQIDVMNETPYVSALSPYLTAGLGFCVDGCSAQGSSNSAWFSSTTTSQIVFTVGLAAEYDVRFVQSGEAFFGLMLGVARRSQQHTRL